MGISITSLALPDGSADKDTSFPSPLSYERLGTEFVAVKSKLKGKEQELQTTKEKAQQDLDAVGQQLEVANAKVRTAEDLLREEYNLDQTYAEIAALRADLRREISESAQKDE